MKKIISIFAVLSMVLALFGCSSGDVPDGNDIVITVEGYGVIKAKLTPEYAPITVENFKKLVAKKAYDGTVFHRIIEGFMIQGGDTGEFTEAIKGEFAANGVKNDLRHERGVLSMARTDILNSATDQFFICHKTAGCEHLDGLYAAFGYVTEGMDVVDKIASVDTNSWNGSPYEEIVITSIRFA